MNSLTPFSFDSREIRVLTVNNEPWFVAKDVLSALEYAESSLANILDRISHVPDEWKGRHPIVTLGGSQELWCLSEPGLYFFLNRSDKPKALPFQKWAAGEVFPAIRKTGSYALPGASSNPVLAAQLADLLQGKVLVDLKTLGTLTRVLYAAQGLLEGVTGLAHQLEQQIGQPLIHRAAPAPVPALVPVPAPAPSRPPIRNSRPPKDPFAERVRLVIVGKKEVTVNEVLRELGEPLHDPDVKKRVIKVLKNFGMCQIG